MSCCANRIYHLMLQLSVHLSGERRYDETECLTNIELALHRIFESLNKHRNSSDTLSLLCVEKNESLPYTESLLWTNLEKNQAWSVNTEVPLKITVMKMKSYWLTWCMKNMLGLKFERMDLQLFFWLLCDVLEKIHTTTFPPSPPLHSMYLHACITHWDFKKAFIICNSSLSL